jgi:type 1 glutamine amidotransferase
VSADDRIDAFLVCGGKYHDFDFARLRLLELLAEDEHVRVKVAQHFHDLDLITAARFLVSYTCDVRPTEDEQRAIRHWVEGGGRWLALHGTNNALDPPAALGEGVFETPPVFPLWVDTLGSQFLSHPSIEPYEVTVAAGAEDDPLITGIGGFKAGADELYLMDVRPGIVPLLETSWTGRTRGFAEAEWFADEPRPVLYRRALGQGEVVYFTLGHCRGHWDMDAPPHNGARYPKIQRGSWEVPQFIEVLRRAIAWARS